MKIIDTVLNLWKNIRDRSDSPNKAEEEIVPNSPETEPPLMRNLSEDLPSRDKNYLDQMRDDLV